MGKIKVGLEIHGYLNTKEKLFCKCKTEITDEPNINICPVCTAQPGAKPMLPNKEALYKVLKLALVFGSKINLKTNFQRKHYTWPDLPSGYQRTVSGSYASFTAEGGEFRGIRIREIHLEEDPAAWDPVTGRVNYNRSGWPLVEIVTEPDFSSPKEIAEWLKELRLYGEYLDIFSQLGFKSDINVSIEESGFQRVEIKNVNSFKNIVRAVEVEVKRQKEIITQGGTIARETRRYNEELEITEFMRSKETGEDYMFIPEPDLPNIVLTEEDIKALKKEIPELPHEKRERYKKFDLGQEDIEVLVSHPYLAKLFDKSIEEGLNPRETGLFLRREVIRVINYHNDTFEDIKKKEIENEILNILKLLSKEEITYRTAQKLIEILYEKKININEYVEENNLKIVKDSGMLEELCKKLIEKNEKAVNDYKKGNEKALNFIVGQVMRETKGTADPHKVLSLLKELTK